MRRKELWRFISVMLAFLFVFSVVNVPKVGVSDAYAATDEERYFIYTVNDLKDFYDIIDYKDEKSDATITIQISPVLDTENEDVKLSTSTYSRLMIWNLDKITTDNNGDSTIVTLKGYKNSDYTGISNYTYESLGLYIYDKNTEDTISNYSFSVYETNYPYTITVNGNGGKMYDYTNDKYITTYKGKTGEGNNLADSSRYWN